MPSAHKAPNSPLGLAELFSKRPDSDGEINLRNPGDLLCGGGVSSRWCLSMFRYHHREGPVSE
jgi:hypothetical protein